MKAFWNDMGVQLFAHVLAGVAALMALASVVGLLTGGFNV